MAGRKRRRCKRADIWRGICWLEAIDQRAAYTVRATVAVGLPLRAVQDYVFRAFGYRPSHETVRCWKNDGLVMMAGYLQRGETT